MLTGTVTKFEIHKEGIGLILLHAQACCNRRSNSNDVATAIGAHTIEYLVGCHSSRLNMEMLHGKNAHMYIN
jgi:hypothetical protein